MVYILYGAPKYIFIDGMIIWEFYGSAVSHLGRPSCYFKNCFILFLHEGYS